MSNFSLFKRVKLENLVPWPTKPAVVGIFSETSFTSPEFGIWGSRIFYFLGNLEVHIKINLEVNF